MKVTVKKEVTKIEEVVIGYRCDVCNKEEATYYTPNGWHEFESHHNEWGNDSIDSSDWHLVCSPKCYISKVNDCVEEWKDYRTTKIDGMAIKFAKELSLIHISEPTRPY